MTLKYDHTGEVFGKLSVLENLGYGVWKVRCECGVEKVLQGSGLRAGNSTSCGCSNPARGTGADHPRWRGDDIKYASAHRRVEVARGRAKEHTCSNCGSPADSWAYRGGSLKELVEERPNSPVKKVVRYSPDPADYDPMCWSCHSRKDIAEARDRVNAT